MSLEIDQTGCCPCKAVKFHAKGTPTFNALCHCRTCARFRGASPVHLIGFNKDDVKFTAGSEHIVEKQAEGVNLKHFICAKCGAGLYQSPNPNRVVLFPTQFQIENPDDPVDCRLPAHLLPKRHINYENRHWDHFDDLPKTLDFRKFCTSDGCPVGTNASQPAPGIGFRVLPRQGAPDTLMPRVGLGTWQAPAGEVEKAVLAALKAGYRHIDAAAIYGNEKEVGSALAQAFSEGIVKRADVFVTSKLWNSEHAGKDVEPALRQTLRDLQLDYLDNYIIHWPQAFQHQEGTHIAFPRDENGGMLYDMESTHEETWKGLEACVDLGLTRHIGLSNFTKTQTENILKIARIRPSVNQVEVHPFFQQHGLVDFCHANGIVVTGYSPLGSGSTVDGHIVPKHPALAAIGEKYGKSAAQVALKQQIQRGIVTIPKSVKESRIIENIDLDFTLSQEDMEALRALDKGIRTGWGGPRVERDGKMRPRDELHPAYPFKMLESGGNDPSVF